jgi:hypothetical protein
MVRKHHLPLTSFTQMWNEVFSLNLVFKCVRSSWISVWSAALDCAKRREGVNSSNITCSQKRGKQHPAALQFMWFMKLVQWRTTLCRKLQCKMHSRMNQEHSILHQYWLFMSKVLTTTIEEESLGFWKCLWEGHLAFRKYGILCCSKVTRLARELNYTMQF